MRLFDASLIYLGQAAATALACPKCCVILLKTVIALTVLCPCRFDTRAGSALRSSGRGSAANSSASLSSPIKGREALALGHEEDGSTNEWLHRAEVCTGWPLFLSYCCSCLLVLPAFCCFLL